MKTKKSFFLLGTLALALVFVLVVAACGKKDSLEGLWKTTYKGEEARIVFVDDRAFADIGGAQAAGTYTYEKKAGALVLGSATLPFTVKGTSLTLTEGGETVVFTKDTQSKTPSEIKGLWTGIDEYGDEVTLAFAGNMVIYSEDAYVYFVYTYTFDKGKGIIDEDDDQTFTVSKDTLTLVDYGDQTTFTRGGKAKAASATQKSADTAADAVDEVGEMLESLDIESATDALKTAGDLLDTATKLSGNISTEDALKAAKGATDALKAAEKLSGNISTEDALKAAKGAADALKAAEKLNGDISTEDALKAAKDAAGAAKQAAGALKALGF
jgi:hypothetical protein